MKGEGETGGRGWERGRGKRGKSEWEGGGSNEKARKGRGGRGGARGEILVAQRRVGRERG